MKYLLFCLFLTACAVTRIVNVSPLNRAVKKNLNKAEVADEQIAKSLVQKKRLKTVWDKNGGDEKFSGYYDKLIEQQRKIAEVKKALKDYYKDHPLHDKHKLTQRDKYYDQVPAYEAHLKDRFDQLDDEYEKFQDLDEDCIDYLKSKEVYLVRTAQAKKDFRRVMNQSDRQMRKAHNYIVKFEEKNPNHKTKTLKKIKESWNAIKAEVETISKNFEMVVQEMHGAKFNYVVPGMKAHNYIDIIHEHHEKMEDLIENYNDQVKKLDEEET